MAWGVMDVSLACERASQEHVNDEKKPFMSFAQWERREEEVEERFVKGL